MAEPSSEIPGPIDGDPVNAVISTATAVVDRIRSLSPLKRAGLTFAAAGSVLVAFFYGGGDSYSNINLPQEATQHADLGNNPQEGKRFLDHDLRLAQAVLNDNFQQKFPLVVASGVAGAQRGTIEGDFPPNATQTDFATGNDKVAVGFDPKKTTSNFGVTVFRYETKKEEVDQVIVTPPHSDMQGQWDSKWGGYSLNTKISQELFNKIPPEIKRFFEVGKKGDYDEYPPVKLKVRSDTTTHPYESYLRSVFKVPRDAKVGKPSLVEFDEIKQQLFGQLGVPLAEPEQKMEITENDLPLYTLNFQLANGEKVEVRGLPSGIASMKIFKDKTPLLGRKEKLIMPITEPVLIEKDWPVLLGKIEQGLKKVVKAPLPPFQTHTDKDTPMNRRDPLIDIWETNPNRNFGGLELKGNFGLPLTPEEQLPQALKDSIIKGISDEIGGEGASIQILAEPILKGEVNAKPGNPSIDISGNLNLNKDPDALAQRMDRLALELAMKKGLKSLDSEQLTGKVTLGDPRSANFYLYLNEGKFPRVNEGAPADVQYKQFKNAIDVLKSEVLYLPDELYFVPLSANAAYFMGTLADGTYLRVLFLGSFTDHLPPTAVTMYTPDSPAYKEVTAGMKSDIKGLIEDFDNRNKANLDKGQPLSPATSDIDDLRAEFGVPFPEYRHNMKPIEPLKPSPTPSIKEKPKSS